jgi:hypothetical protein
VQDTKRISAKSVNFLDAAVSLACCMALRADGQLHVVKACGGVAVAVVMLQRVARLADPSLEWLSLRCSVVTLMRHCAHHPLCASHFLADGAWRYGTRCCCLIHGCLSLSCLTLGCLCCGVVAVAATLMALVVTCAATSAPCGDGPKAQRRRALTVASQCAAFSMLRALAFHRQKTRTIIDDDDIRDTLQSALATLRAGENDAGVARKRMCT